MDNSIRTVFILFVAGLVQLVRYDGTADGTGTPKLASVGIFLGPNFVTMTASLRNALGK